MTTTRDGSVRYATLRQYPAERTAHGSCYECGGLASYFLLAHEYETGRPVGVMLCGGHTTTVAIDQGALVGIPENPALRRRHLGLVR